MSDITVTQMLHMTHMAQQDLGKGRWTDITTDLQEYFVLPKLLRRQRVGFQSGLFIEGNVMTDDNGSAKHVGLFATDSYEDVDGTDKFRVDWTHTTANWSYDRRQVKMNRGKSKILDVVTFKRAQAMISLARKLEQAFWTAPTDVNDNLRPYGLPYWIVQSATAGHNGGNPSGFPAGAGNLDSTTYPWWRNYTDEFDDYTKSDLVAKMRECYAKTMFKSPITQPNYRRGNGRRNLYTDYTVLSNLETIGEKQNDNLGRDIASMDGQILFRGVPVDWVPYLENNTTNNPIYYVDWACIYFVFLMGEYLEESPAEVAAGQHTVIKSDIDLTANTRCVDRRRLGVIRKAA